MQTFINGLRIDPPGFITEFLDAAILSTYTIACSFNTPLDPLR